MRTDKLKKYLLPNLPYLFIGWACLKVGTAYRLAAGADLAHKLVGMVAALGPAFADFAPGLNPFDWLTGIVGAVAIRLASQVWLMDVNKAAFKNIPPCNLEGAGCIISSTPSGVVVGLLSPLWSALGIAGLFHCWVLGV